MDEVSIVDTIMNLRTKCMSAWASATRKSHECDNYVLNNPYTAEEEERANELSKPLLKYPVINSRILALMGQEQANRRGIHITPGRPQETDLTEIAMTIFDDVMEREDIWEKSILVAVDGWIKPIMGFIKRDLIINDMGYLDFTYSVLNSYNVHIDAETRDYDLSDCSYVIIDNWMTLDEIRNEYKGMSFAETKSFGKWDEVEESFRDQETRYGVEETQIGDRYLVCHLKERKYETEYFVFRDNRIVAVDEESLVRGEEVINSRQRGYIRETIVVPHFKQDVVLYDSIPEIKTSNFGVFPIGSFKMNYRLAERPSLVGLLIDPQANINKRMSQHTDYITQMLGAPWFVGYKDEEASRELQRVGNQPGAVIRIKNFSQKPYRDFPHAVETGSLQTAQVEQSFIEDITNIRPAQLGSPGKSGESGKKYQMQLTQALTATNPYYENIAELRKRIAQDWCDLAPQVYFEDGRLIENQYGQLLLNLNYNGKIYNNMREALFKAQLDDSDNTPTRIEQKFNILMMFIELLQKAGYPPELLPIEYAIEQSQLPNKEEFLRKIQQAERIMGREKALREATEQFNLLQGGQSA
jgi:hypothetical protein